MKPTRLFDCIPYQLELGAKEDMLAAKEEGGIWKKYSTHEVQDLVNKLSAGLLHMNIGPNDMSIEGRDKVAVLSNNRPEWLILDLAVQQIGAVLTPIYPTISVHELEFVLNDAAVKLVFVSDVELYEKVQSIREKTPTVKAVFTFNPIQQALYWKDILAKGTEADLARVEEIKASIQYEDLCTIIYTSGTTDIFERMVSYIYMFYGCSIYYAESLEKIGDNLKEVQPTVFATVPRLLEKVYDRIIAKGHELTGIKKKLFFWAVDIGNRFEIDKNQGWWYRMQLALANKLIFSKWKEGLGGKVKAIVTGAAACQVRLLRIFTAGQIVIMEGYGLTETSPVITVNRFDDQNRRFGTVGPLINGVEVKLEADGEICCKGDNVMMGYYKQPQLTAEVLTKDGWFHTGDIGVWQEGKFLKITDRKKEIFKTSGGKYVAPQPIENKMKESPFIEQMMVVGAEQKFAGALIVPAMPTLLEWSKQHNVGSLDNAEALLQDPKVIELYKSIVEEYNKDFNHVEQVKKFELINGEWTIDGGELTPTLKLKRKVIMQKYADAVERIYN